MHGWWLSSSSSIRTSSWPRIRSRRGASFGLLGLVGKGVFDVAVSVPLVLEYEDAMLRMRGGLSTDDVRALIDYICTVARRQSIYLPVAATTSRSEG